MASIKDYSKLNQIGHGTYGVVYKAEEKNTNNVVALKKFIIEW